MMQVNMAKEKKVKMSPFYTEGDILLGFTRHLVKPYSSPTSLRLPRFAEQGLAEAGRAK
jgi:hypothetical protein